MPENKEQEKRIIDQKEVPAYKSTMGLQQEEWDKFRDESDKKFQKMVIERAEKSNSPNNARGA